MVVVFNAISVIDAVNGYAYFGNADNTGTIIKVNLTSPLLEVVASNTVSDQLYTSVIDSNCSYAYFGGYSGQIFEVDLMSTSLSVVRTVATGYNNLKTSVIDSVRGNVYFWGGNSVLLQVNLKSPSLEVVAQNTGLEAVW